MKKLRNVLAAALLTIPLASLSASTASDAAGVPEMRPTRIEYCCTVYLMGRYYCLPC